jgi:glutamate-1-semialdehyde 2,1-aminomutase
VTTHLTSRSADLFAQAEHVVPGGVNSPVRAFGSVGGTPRFIREAKGATITDVDGNEWIDFVGSWGPMILGHGSEVVEAAVGEALRRGTSFGAPCAGEVELARLIVDSVPSIDMVRLVNSGTEATMSAVRLARAATGRDVVVKFRGAYHGHADSFLVQAGSGAATLGVPSSPGVTEGTARDTLVADYNDLASVRERFASRRGKIACVIVEPVAGNMGCVPPVPGFLEGLRDLCDEAGALLIFDEVMTGFRVGLGGAQERYGVRPDLTALGKVIGGGLPVGAYGGRADLMARIAPSGPVYQAGTLSGNPLSVAAGAATLRRLRSKPDVFAKIDVVGRALDEGFTRLEAEGLGPLVWHRVGAMGGFFLADGPILRWEDAQRGANERFKRFFWAMLDAGFYLPPSPYEALFLSEAHTVEHVAAFIDAARAALSAQPREAR